MKKSKIFRVILILLAILIGCGYVFLRIKSRGNEMIFNPPSQRYIEKTFIEKYGEELETIAEYALEKEEFYWFFLDKEELKVNGEIKKATEAFPVIEELYNAGLDSIRSIDEDTVQFEVWSDLLAYVSGFIYAKTGECEISGVDNLTLERIGDTNWFYYVYSFEL